MCSTARLWHISGILHWSQNSMELFFRKRSRCAHGDPNNISCVNASWSALIPWDIYRGLWRDESCCAGSRHPIFSGWFMAFPTTSKDERKLEKTPWRWLLWVYKRQISVGRQLVVSFLRKITEACGCVVLSGFISPQRAALSDNLCYKGMHLQNAVERDH